MYIGMQELLVPTLMALSGITGYYIGHRGIAGVKSDLADVKMDVDNIKNKLNPPQTVVIPVTPNA